MEDMIAEDRMRIEEELGEYGLEELARSVEPDEDGNREYLTEIPDEPQEEEATRRLDEQIVQYTADQTDQINRLYIGGIYSEKRF